MSILKKTSALLGAGVLTLGLTACADSEGNQTITMGYLPSWSDGLSLAYVLDDQLTRMGYEVEHETLSDAAALYAGLANGDVDIYPSAWPEVTHASYMDEYSDSIEDLGSYYDNAKLNLSVPEYMDINSIEELAGQADRFDGTIYGIEPGAGLTRATQEDVLPGYGLDSEYELVTSSTPAMLSELQTAVDNEEDIVVTLWTPFWANNTFPVKALEDPEGLYGEPESLHFLAREGFTEEFGEVADYISQIQMTDEQYGDLEDLVVNEYEDGEEDQAVQAWLEQYPDVLPPVEEESAS